MKVREGWIYSESAGTKLQFDFFAPDSQVPLPMVVCIHGGGWISLDRGDMREVAIGFAEMGFAAATVDYRLAPLYPYPSAVDDLWEFIRFVRTTAAEMNVNPNQIASFGNSAGGHLALMIGLTQPPLESDSRVNAVIDICGLVDLTAYKEQHLPISWSFIEQFMGCPYNGNEKVYSEASPLYHVSSEDPPVLIVHGEQDDIVRIDQSEALYSKLQQFRVPSEIHRFPNEGHSFSYDAWLEIERLSFEFICKEFGLK